MYFQSIDDKSECIGVYVDGQLHFDNFPPDLTHTWRYTGSVADANVEYAWLCTNGSSLAQCCPEEHAEELQERLNHLNHLRNTTHSD